MKADLPLFARVSGLALLVFSEFGAVRLTLALFDKPTGAGPCAAALFAGVLVLVMWWQLVKAIVEHARPKSRVFHTVTTATVEAWPPLAPRHEGNGRVVLPPGQFPSA